MRKLLSRTQYNQWLNKGIKLSSRLYLFGFKGAGKSTFTRQWLQDNKYDFKWYSLSNRSTLQASLGLVQNTPIEVVLNDSNFFKASFVVWDDFHFLAQSLRTQILDSLAFATQTCHIFLSEEKLENYPEIPQLVIEGFNQTELHEYLQQLEVAHSQSDLQKLQQSTGGLPLLVNLWVQSPQKQDTSFLIGNTISQQALELLCSLSFFSQPLDSQLYQSQQTQLNELESKLLIEWQGQKIVVPPIVRTTALERLTPSEYQAGAQHALQFLHTHHLQDFWQEFTLSLKAKDLVNLKRLADQLPYSTLEQMSSSVLSELLQDLDMVMSESSEAPLKRLKIQLLILLGQRDKALDYAKWLLKNQNNYEDVANQWMLFDAIHWIHRAGIQFATAEPLSQLINRSQRPLLYFFKLEQALPYVYSEPKRALETLQRLYKELNNQESELEKQLYAQVCFQLGVVNNQMQDYGKALHFFDLAQKTYLGLGRYYHSAFSQFNKTWIYFFTQDQQQFAENFQALSEAVERWGYRLLNVGLKWLAAESHYQNLQSQKAFKFLQEADGLIGRHMPIKTRLDLFISKCRVLLDLGLEAQALQTYQDGKIEFADLQDSRLTQLALELNYLHLSVDEIHDSWLENGGNDSDETLIYLMILKGVHNESWPSSLSKTKRGQLYLLLDAVFKNKLNRNELRTSLQQLLLLLKDSDLYRYRIAANLALYTLAPNQAELAKAEQDLQTMAAQSQVNQDNNLAESQVLHFWLQKIKNDQEPLEHWAQQNFNSPTQLQWLRWIQLGGASQATYRMFTRDGHQDIAKLPEKFAEDGIVLVEDRGLVILKKKKITDFHRKPKLRQILALLMEVFPGSLSKANLAFALWGEEYAPQIHDSRVYTSIQRLRVLLKTDVIETWQDGYRWKPDVNFYYFRSLQNQDLGSHRVKTLILEALKKSANLKQPSLNRAALVEASGSSDATVKRVLSKLIEEGLVTRSGRGPAVQYSLRISAQNKV